MVCLPKNLSRDSRSSVSLIADRVPHLASRLVSRVTHFKAPQLVLYLREEVHPLARMALAQKGTSRMTAAALCRLAPGDSLPPISATPEVSIVVPRHRRPRLYNGNHFRNWDLGAKEDP